MVRSCIYLLTHSGTANPVAALLPKKSNAVAIESAISLALGPSMSDPNRAVATMRRVTSLKSE